MSWELVVALIETDETAIVNRGQSQQQGGSGVRQHGLIQRGDVARIPDQLEQHVVHPLGLVQAHGLAIPHALSVVHQRNVVYDCRAVHVHALFRDPSSSNSDDSFGSSLTGRRRQRQGAVVHEADPGIRGGGLEARHRVDVGMQRLGVPIDGAAAVVVGIGATVDDGRRRRRRRLQQRVLDQPERSREAAHGIGIPVLQEQLDALIVQIECDIQTTVHLSSSFCFLGAWFVGS